MPKESKQEVGRAGVRPFTPPRVDVSTPGLQRQAQPTRLEMLREAMGLAGKAAATVAQGRASINATLNTLKEKAIARVERDQRIAAQALGQQRAKESKKNLMGILVEGEDRGTQWTEQRLRSEMANAGSEEEKMLYQTAWLQVKDHLDREDAMDQEKENELSRQSFNMAARTASAVVGKLEEQLLADEELKQRMIGDGANISQRVQDWILAEAASASPSAFADPDEDLPDVMRGELLDNRDRLIHQLTEHSFRISQNLLKDYNRKLDGANVSRGTVQVAADVHSLGMGKQTIEMTERQLNYVKNGLLASQHPDVAMDTIRNAVMGEVNALTSGMQGVDSVDDAITHLDDILNLTVDGEALFAPIEQATLRVQAMNNVAKVAPQMVANEVAEFRLKNQQDVTLPDGTTIKRFDPAALDQLADEYDRIEFQLHRMLGIEGEMTPNEAAVSAEITRAVDTFRSSLDTTVAKHQRARQNYDTWRTGTGPYDSEQVLQGSPFFQVTTNAENLTNAQLSQLKQDLVVTAERLAGSVTAAAEWKAAIDAWQGKTVEWKPENRHLLNALAAVDAGRATEGFNESSEIPNSIVTHRERLWNTGDPLKQEVSARWFASLPEQALNNALVELPEGMNAAMTYLTRVEALGRPGAGPTIQNLGPQVDAVTGVSIRDWDTTLNEAREVQDMIDNSAGFAVIEETPIAPSVNIARMMHAALSEEYGDRGIDEKNIRTLADARGTLSLYYSAGQAEDVLDSVTALWMGIKAAKPTMTDSQIAYSVNGFLQKAGINMVEIAGEPVAIHDPHRIFGTKAGTKIETKMAEANAFAFHPHVKAAFSEAYGTEINGYRDIFFHMAVREGRITPSPLGAKLEDAATVDMVSVYWAGNAGLHEEMMQTHPTQGGGAVLNHTVEFASGPQQYPSQGWPVDWAVELHGTKFEFRKGDPIVYNPALLVSPPAVVHERPTYMKPMP